MNGVERQWRLWFFFFLSCLCWCLKWRGNATILGIDWRNQFGAKILELDLTDQNGFDCWIIDYRQ
jgi:hypothetical protein